MKKKGFTFIEIMIALAILSLCVVVVYQSLFVLLGVLGYSTDRLQAQYFIDNRVWELENCIEIGKGLPVIKEGSSILGHGKDFSWSTKISALRGLKSLSKIQITAVWKSMGKQIRVSRSAYIESAKVIQEAPKEEEKKALVSG